MGLLRGFSRVAERKAWRTKNRDGVLGLEEGLDEDREHGVASSLEVGGLKDEEQRWSSGFVDSGDGCIELLAWVKNRDGCIESLARVKNRDGCIESLAWVKNEDGGVL